MPTGRGNGPGWKRVSAYGGLLATGLVALQWLGYPRLAGSQIGEIAIALAAGGVLVLGIVIGIRTFAPRAPTPSSGDPQAVASLGITRQELAVLHEIAAGRSNEEIAIRLAISPDRIKTHVDGLFGKLGVARRTDALARARALRILP